MLSARELADRLAGLSPLHLDALDIALTLVRGDETAAKRTPLVAQIENAADALQTHARTARATIERVLTCKPQPATQLPPGF
jgi:hypothetical protein